MREREGLIARIRQTRRIDAPEEASTPTGDADTGRLEALEARVAQLEQMVQGLQDSVHRESDRHGTLIAELQAQVQPAAMSAALSKDSRDRGL
jgi:hypothetical protein